MSPMSPLKYMEQGQKFFNSINPSGGYDEKGNPKYGAASGVVDYMSKGITANEYYAGTGLYLQGIPNIFKDFFSSFGSFTGGSAPSNPSTLSNMVNSTPVEAWSFGNKVGGSAPSSGDQIDTSNWSYVGKTSDLLDEAYKYAQQVAQAGVAATSGNVTNYVTIVANNIDDLEGAVEKIMKNYGTTSVMRK